MNTGDFSPILDPRVAALSRQEKEAIALGRWDEAPSVTGFVYTDGGNGIRDAEGATAFPSALALAATFDVALARQYGQALGRETRFAGRNVLLGPVLDVARVPWDGRTGEGLGEDPELVSQIGGAIIEGVHSANVLAVVKHLAANNSEFGRTGLGSIQERTDGVDVVVDETTLREVYLKPFERAVKEHGAAGLMSSYNRVNGSYPAEDPAIWRMVREEWGFRGVTLPDYLMAVRNDAAALEAGLDLPGLDDHHGRTPEMVAGLSDSQLDTLVSHVLHAAESVGLAVAEPRTEELGSADTLDLAEEIVINGTVLLANNGILPLSPGARVALVSPESLDHLLTIGGSAAVPVPEPRRSRLAEELRSSGWDVDEIVTEAADRPLPAATAGQGVSNITALITVDGITSERELPEFALADDVAPGRSWSADVHCEFVAPQSGAFRITVTFAGRATVAVDGKPAVSGFREASPMIAGPEYPLHLVLDLDADEHVTIAVAYETHSAITIPGTPLAPGFRLGIAPLDDLNPIMNAVRGADVAIVVLGRASGEAMDVESLHLPDDQLRVLEAVASAQPNTVVVTMGSGPVVIGDVPKAALLHAWQAGERAAHGLASILSGLREPRGRLPLTFPENDEQVPLTADDYPGNGRRMLYTEGLDVGYRGYAAAGLVPAYPFGHGLGYADVVLGEAVFDLGEGLVTVAATATNIGDREGAIVAQLYARKPGGASATLIGFQKAVVSPGADAAIRIDVDLNRLASWSDGAWSVTPGEYEMLLGLSSADRSRSGVVTIGASPS